MGLLSKGSVLSESCLAFLRGKIFVCKKSWMWLNNLQKEGISALSVGTLLFNTI